MPTVKGKEIKSQALRAPKGFLLYGKLRPYLNKYWINNLDLENIICSSEFFVFDINQEMVNRIFFKYVLSSEIIKRQIADKTSGARMPRINEEVFFNLEFPLPPIEIQNQICDKLNALTDAQKLAKDRADRLKQTALREFEEKIFKKYDYSA
jgi:restriction endonuclease S subunit